jgi:hypothetical protein
MRFSLIRLSPGQSTGRIPQCHSGWPPVPATHEAPRRVDSVLAVAVTHPARGPSLRRVVLSTPILATTPSSDFRSTLHHFTDHAYRFRCYRSTRRRHPPGPCCRCRDGSLLFHDGLCDRSAPITPTGLWCCTSKVFTPSVAFARMHGARHPHVSRSRGVVSRRGYRIPCVRTDHLLAAHGDFVMALRQSDLSFRRPPATGPLGRYPGRTLTGKSIAASRTHCTPTTANPHAPTPQRSTPSERSTFSNCVSHKPQG